mgnify:CR=1 FL=1
MWLALQQANRVLGNTKDNPAVGCILTKNSHAVYAGHTSIGGRPHAEQNVLKNYNKNFKNTNLYITLEPCSNFGKTSPCVDLIIKKKIKNVYFSIEDPDIRSFNKSIKKFKKKKISAKHGILSSYTNSFYRSYIKSRREVLPFVTIKLAISKDFYTINKKKNQWITNEYSRGRVHLMRSEHDCIITSSKTVLKDNPEMTCRINGLEDKSPSRIILDRKLNISVKSHILKNAKKIETIILHNSPNKKKIKALKKEGIKFYRISSDIEGNLNLYESLLLLKRIGFSRIFVESGINLIKEFLKQNLVDEFKLFISNNKLKNNGAGYAKNILDNFLKNKKIYENNVNLFGDVLKTYKVQ